MRKDVRLGLAVGGILFGVVLVYVLFFAGGKGEDQLADDLDALASAGAVMDPSGTSAGTDPAPNPGNPNDPGTTLVDIGSQSSTGTPTAPLGDRNRTQNPAPPMNWNPVGGINPTTRPSAPSDSFSPPVASAGQYDWRKLMTEGAQAPIWSETPGTPELPGGERRLIDEGRNVISPPMPGTELEVRAGEGTAGGPRIYVVQPGDSFWSIAKAEYGNASYYHHVVRANPKVDATKLKAGMRITIPGRDEVIPQNAPPTAVSPTPVVIDETRQYRVKKGDNLSNIAQRLYGRASMTEKLYQLNRDVIGPDPSALKLNAILILPETPTRVAGAGN